MIEKYLFPTLMLLAQAIVLLVGLLKAKNDRGKYRYNPHPPGEAATCIEHTSKLASLETALELSKEDICRRLDRIEEKQNGAK